MSMNLSGLISSAIRYIGRGDALPVNTQLDNHSAITLYLGNAKCIHVMTIDDTPVIWSVICEYKRVDTRSISESLLSVMNNYSPFFHFGQPALVNIDGNIELRATFSLLALKNEETMAAAINDYALVMENIFKIYNIN